MRGYQIIVHSAHPIGGVQCEAVGDMETKCKIHHILEVVLLLICLVVLSAENLHANEDSKYLDTVREFADNVLKYGRDTYGPKHTPLFVDGLNIHTHEPVKWIDPDGTKWILSNLASQQNLFRTLDGLTKITGDPKYKQAAMDAIKYAFENLRSPNGLLYWGIKVAYDAQKDSIYSIDSIHVLKSQHPYYELMWDVDAEATRQFIEAFWSTHILDWSNLEMDRIGRFNYRIEKPWIQKYTGGPVFFQGRGRSMLTTGSDLFCAAGLLTKLSGDREPLNWAKRLAYRYVETRDPRAGISGHRYTRKEPDEAQYQFGEDFEGRLIPQYRLLLVPPVPGLGDPDIKESILGYLIITPGIEYSITTGPWVSSMILGDILGNDGGDFIKWGLEELTALGKVAYRQQNNAWIPMFNDGTSLEGYVCKKDGAFGWRGLEFKAIPAVSMDFWAYALTYRITCDQFMWRMTRNIASGHDLGDIGITPESHHQLKTATDCWQPFTLLGFLELYKKTGNQAFLQIAQSIGDNLLAHRFHKGFFMPSDRHIYTKFDAIEPLALLHLHVALKASSTAVPIVWPSRSIFDAPYRHRRLAMDNSLIYTLTDSLEPPRSLCEVAMEGDPDAVRAMIARGANVNARDHLFGCALHYASGQGHIEIAELLIAKGARVDAGPDTPLHYAVENGHKDMIELLIANGAEVNAKNESGETPLHYAARTGLKDIADMLIANGADIDIGARSSDTYTALHYAVENGHKDVTELLIAKGADVNAKGNKGDTALLLAKEKGHTEIVELLRKHGAKE
ncbi:MAG: ankyrin repeat domain-containing protein [Sedimentisphaerales bacterium]